MGRLRSWLRLPARERRSVLAALGAVIAVRVLLWLLPYRLVLRTVHVTARSPRGRPAASDGVAHRIARDVGRAARVVPRASCLVQALAGEWLMVRAGAPVALRYGVAFGERGFEAHAWLESDGRVILGGEEAARFAPLRSP